MVGDYDQYVVSRMPDDDDNNFDWSIVRAPTDGVVKLVVLSHDIFGIRVHFHNRRTQPHLQVNCPGCATGLSRWKGYVLCIEPKSQRKLVLEFTPPGAYALDAALAGRETMRGFRIKCGRRTAKANGKVFIEFEDQITLPKGAPEAIDTWGVLSRIWGMNKDVDLREASHLPYDLSDFEKEAG